MVVGIVVDWNVRITILAWHGSEPGFRIMIHCAAMTSGTFSTNFSKQSKRRHTTPLYVFMGLYKDTVRRMCNICISFVRDSTCLDEHGPLKSNAKCHLFSLKGFGNHKFTKVVWWVLGGNQ